MRRLSAVLILLCLSAVSAAAQKRTITETDLFRFVWVADPQRVESPKAEPQTAPRSAESQFSGVSRTVTSGG